MNKGDLIDKIAADADITKAAAGSALNAFIDAVKSTIASGDKITLVGFGTFSVTKRSARTGRNPQTGKEIKIAARNVAKFKAGADLTASAQKAKIK